MRKLFGTDGVRGVANEELTPELAFRLGRAGGYVITKNINKPKIVIGRDTRLSGEMLESALISGLLSIGIEVVRLGVLPTPGVAFLTRKLKANGGIMISASHNPFQDNGIKFFNQDGFKLKDETEEEIERLIENDSEIPRVIGEKIGFIKESQIETEEYKKFLQRTVDNRFDGLKIVLDCANGAASNIAGSVFKNLGAEVIVIHSNPNGVNINVDCGSTHPENLQNKVIEENADLGLAFDGDADRLIAVNQYGEIIDGDDILFILANSLKEKNKLQNDVVVSTVMSNFGFSKVLKEYGIKTVQTTVGDRYVLEEMVKNGYKLGGEQSGHIIFLEHNTTGDGLLTAVQLVNELKRKGETAKELLKNFKKYPQKLVNVKVGNKNGWENNNSIREAIKEAEKELDGNGRILVRASGTENLIRVMAEGETDKIVDKMVNDIAMTIQNSLNVI